MEAEVLKTLEYKGSQLIAAPILEVENLTNWKKSFMCHIIDDQMNSVINCLTAKSTWDDLILYHEVLFDVKESRVMDLKLCYNTFKFKEGETLTQTFTRYKALMNELVNDGIKLSKKKSFVTTTSLSTAFFSTSIVQDFQDSLDDKKDKRSSQEYLNDLEEEYQERALLANSKRFFKKGSQRFTSAKETDDTICHKCGRKCHFKPELRPNKDFEAKYNNNKAKLALLSSGTLSKSSMVKNNGLVAKAYEWNEKDVSSNDNKMTEVKHVNTEILKENKNLRTELKELTVITKTWLKSSNKVNQCINEQIPSQKKRISGLDQLTEDPSGSGQTDLVFVKSLAEDIKVSISGVERPWLSKAEGFILPNHDTGRIIPFESQVNTTDPPVAVTDSLLTKYDSADESLVCSTPLPPSEKLDGAEPVSGPKTIKLILKSNSTFKAEALKGNLKTEGSPKCTSKQIQNTIQKGCELYGLNNHLSENCYKVLFCKKYERTDHRTYDHVEYMSTVNMSQHLKSQGGSSSRSRTPRPSKHFFPPCIHCGFNDHIFDDCVNYPICDICGSYDHDTHGHNKVISLRRGIKPRNPQQVTKSYETCGSTVHTTTDHNDIDWFIRGEALQAKKDESFQSKKTKSSNANRSKTPTKSGCSRHMAGVKSYLHKYVEQPRPKVVFGDDSTCITKGYGSIKCNGIFNEKRGTIFNSNKEIVMIAPRVRDVYVLDMTSFVQESCFFAKATENLNWLWQKRLAHLNFKTINQLAKQNLVICLPSLVYSKDKPCSSCEKRKYHRASFKTKQTSSIKKCLHLLRIDLFRPLTPRSINHEKFTLVIVDECSRTLIEAARTILSGSVFSKQYWTEAVATACYTQNRSTIVKRHLKTPYEIFCGIILNIDFLHVFGWPVYIHNHKDYLGKFDEKADDGYFLGYSLVSKAFKVFNTKRQQIKETYHITFVECIVDPYERPEPVVIKTDVKSDQHDQADQNDQNDHSAQAGEIINDDQSKHSNHNNDNHIIDNLPNIKDVQTSEPLSSPAKDALVSNTIPISTNPSLSIPSMASPAPQDRWSQNKHIELVFKNKRDEIGIVIKNKARLVAQGYNQQEGIDYDETFALVVRLEEIKIFLTFSIYMNFIVYQMEVKSAFLNEKLKEEVFVKQPPSFKRNKFLNHVCKLNKALYRLKQAPRAWYETLLTFLTEQKSTSTKLCKQFAKLIIQRYEMNMMGVLSYFLGFQIKQSERGILINQEKYVKDPLKKYDINGSSVKTPMVPPNNLGPDLNGKAVNETHYRGMIGSLMYLKGTLSLGIWYLKCSGVDLKGYSDSDYVGCNMDRKSTSGEAEYVAVAQCCANILWMKSHLTDYG
ncbi:retrovirus-related pol polyprotein from transposon TNT 1-94 [Tanacetum coccineum]|uniref:Retrovirus-related pol polyprotein from transposon TNT 1-94 n=1 Tax=Tanacetum coccineum TaxID=301880 RepID=A0ABQ5JBA7_9ASTR